MVTNSSGLYVDLNMGSSAIPKKMSFDKLLGGAGLLMSLTGMVTGAMGSYFSARSQKLKLKSQASSYEFHAKMSDLNAKLIEQQAWSVLRDGQRRSSMATLRAGQVKSTARAMMGARNIQLGVGSAGEAQASTEVMKDIEKLAIDANTVISAENLRMQKVGMQSAGALQRVSAENMINSSNSISQWGNTASSLLTSGTSFISSFQNRKKYDFLLGNRR